MLLLPLVDLLVGLAPDTWPLLLLSAAELVWLCALVGPAEVPAEAEAGEEALAAAAHPPLTTLMTRLSPIIIEGRPMPHEPEPAWAIAASSAAAAAATAAAADEGEALPNKSSRASALLPPTAAALDAAGRARVPLRLVPMLGEHVPGDDDWPPPPPSSDAPPGRRRLWPARVGAPGDGIGSGRCVALCSIEWKIMCRFFHVLIFGQKNGETRFQVSGSVRY